MTQEAFQVVAIALGLGLLVGLQREHANSKVAGIRTFPLITLLGALMGLLSPSLGGWALAGGFAGITALIVVANLLRIQSGDTDKGQTTEAAILLMYGVGAYLAVGDKTLAVTVGGLVAVLLHSKGVLHGLVRKIGFDDIKVVMQFVLLSLVILPVLPDQTFGPYQVLNPRDMWLMVVLIVGISISGYFAYKIFGQKAGTLLGGILGGMISSTATTVSYARRSKQSPGASMVAAVVILIASAIAFVRILVAMAVVAPNKIRELAPPLGAMLLLMLLLIGGLFLWRRKKEPANALPDQGNPAQLKSALVFGALYGLVLLASAAAKDHLGDKGLYLVALVSGLADVNAITLSTAKMVAAGRLGSHTGWQLILLAALANLVFKAGLVAFLGDRRLLRQVALLFGITLAGGGLILWLWPAGWPA
ncbi:MAG: MgtC/SapB family protein [Adhaeribacter sp.]